MRQNIPEDKSIMEEIDELGQRRAYHDYLSTHGTPPLTFEQFVEQQATPKRYVGCWSEENNSEYAGFTRGTYATPEEAMAAAKKAAFGSLGNVRVWARETEDAA